MVDFYPSISEELVTKSLKFSESYTNIPTEDLVLIKNDCKSKLYDRQSLWQKKKDENNDSLFDVTQGSYLGAELCELVDLFVLGGLRDIFGPGNVELYRGKCMAVLPNCSAFKVDRLKKQTQTYLKSLGLRITVESQLMITGFLDVELNLNDISNTPYRKQNSNIIYININSSYPKNIIKQIPNIIKTLINV